MKNKIAYIVATQYDNVGDLLINKCLIDELSLHGKVYLDTKNVPKEFKKELLKNTKNVDELSNISQYSFKGSSFLSLFFKNKELTHIFKSPGPFGCGGDNNVFIKHLIFGLIFKLFKLNKVKSYLVGNDVHVADNLDIKSIKFISKNTQDIFCRSYSNLNELKQIGLNNVDYIPDMCFAYSPKKIFKKVDKETIGISFRRLNDKNYHQNILKSIHYLLENYDYKVQFFYQVDHDFEYNNELYLKFKENNKVSFNKKCLQWDDLYIYNNFSYTFSNRLHVLLLGLVHDVIPIGFLNNDLKTKKIIDIFYGVGLADFIFNDFNNAEFNNFFQKKENHTKIINKVNSEQKQLIRSKISKLFEF